MSIKKLVSSHSGGALVAALLWASAAAAQNGMPQEHAVDEAASELQDVAGARHVEANIPIDPNWMDSLAPGEVCGTFQRYLAELGPAEFEPVLAGVCLEDGPCDDPVNRDASVPAPDTPIKTYQLIIHVFCSSNGGNCAATQAEVNEAVARLNEHYDPWRIQFNYETQFVNSTKYRFLSSDEEVGMKQHYAVSPGTMLNVYVVDTGGLSWGTFPWSPDALTFMGGIVIHEAWFVGVLPTVFTHEVGHCFGLWHTHHGVSEVTECGDCYECAERPPDVGDVTGDRCSDTEPTPMSATCGDPGSSDPCTDLPWVNTPWRNYMGNAGSGTSCPPIEFTPHQAGRMHCWTVDVLSGWLVCATGADCDDGNPCTDDACVGGVCSNTPVDCDDGDPCTDDWCDPATGLCVHDPINCDDGDPCTADSCDPTSGCVSTFPACGLADGCCGPACDPGSDPDCTTSCGPHGTSCTDDSDCCSGNCKNGTCRGN